MSDEKNNDGVFLRIHGDDADMVEIYTKKNNGVMLIWGCVHSDMISQVNGRITLEDLANEDQELFTRIN